MKHVVMYSGGAGSWATAKRVITEHGRRDVTLLFTDTLIEDDDLYRFLDDSAALLGIPITRVADGRTPWQVFRDKRYIGNTRLANCSHLLKQEPARAWVREHCDPEDTTLYLGIDWMEEHRVAGARAGWQPYRTEFPLLQRPLMAKSEYLEDMRRDGLNPPRLYAMGAVHNNCGGFCVKAGQAQFAWLLANIPDRYGQHEVQEQELREYLGKDVSILRDRRRGVTAPLTMRAFREGIQSGEQPEMFDWGGCGCFLDA